MNHATPILSLILFLVFFQGHAQSGWTRKANGFYLQTTVAHYSSNNYYTTEGNLSDTGSTFNSNAFVFYGEYGIAERLTGILNVPALVLNRFSTTETVAGVGSVKVGLKYRIFETFPLALQTDFEIPTNDGINFAKSKNANALGTFDEINLPTSDGEFNVWMTLAASHSFPNGKTYGSLYSSINFRTESFSNQFQAGAEIGHFFFDKFYLIGKLRILEKLSSEGGNQGGSFLYGEGTTFTAYDLNAIYKLGGHLSLVMGYSDYTGFLVERRNIYDGGTFSLGLSWEH